MSQSLQARNKALVLEAFDTLFNKRDYAKAERYWSPDYIQHSAHIAPGREGLFNLIKGIPPTLKYEPGVIAAEAVNEALLLATITTNLMGPIRLTGALIEHLKKQDYAAVLNVSSVLGFVPLAMAAVYCSTKAAIHSYTLSLRYQLKGSSVEVLEIAPPWVQTDLLNSNNEPRAMPLAEFISESIKVMGTGAQEVLVERAKPLRNNVGPNEGAFVTQFNNMMVQPNSPGA